jgi:hypothetical protein
LWCFFIFVTTEAEFFPPKTLKTILTEYGVQLDDNFFPFYSSRLCQPAWLKDPAGRWQHW